MDEVFGQDYQTTGLSRALRNACNGRQTCNQVLGFLQGHQRRDMLSRLRRCLVTDLLCCAKTGIVDDKEEDKLCRSLQEFMAQFSHDGLVWELNWILCHAGCMLGRSTS